jgi:hypothetical protein
MARRILEAVIMSAALTAAVAGPPSRDGLRVWLDASDQASLSVDGGGRVAKWANRVPDGPAAVPDPGSAPLLVADGMGGKPVVRFDGKQWLRLPALREKTGPVAVFVVAQRLAGQASDTKWQRVVSCWDGQPKDDNKPPCFCQIGDAKGTGKPFDPMVFDIVRDDVGLYPIWLGRNGRHEGQNFHGDIAEVLVYDRGFLSEDAIQNVLRYLGDKWGAYVVRKDKGWTLVGPLKDIPKRTTDTLPLSDQGNEGNWVVYPGLTDEFTGDTLDPAKWWPTNPKWAGRQPALFHASNVKVVDGELRLTMRKWFPLEGTKRKGYHDYTSAAVQSKERVLYGYFEIEAMPMRSHGSSAFWFYASTKEIWTEIDVFEIGGGAPGFEAKYNMNAHVFHTPKEHRHWNIGGTWVAPWQLADAFHVYGLEWTKEELKYFVDGVLVRRMKNTHWHQPLTLNFDSETMPNWFGMPRDQDLPSTFRIRYVRAWKQREP